MPIAKLGVARPRGLGALLAVLVIAAVNWRYDPAFWSELRESVRVKNQRPLGEVRLAELLAARRARRPPRPDRVGGAGGRARREPVGPRDPDHPPCDPGHARPAGAAHTAAGSLQPTRTGNGSRPEPGPGHAPPDHSVSSPRVAVT
jgi:hypothetical protein